MSKPIEIFANGGVIRLLASSENCHFGSAPDEYFQHCDWSRAWIDGNQEGRTMWYLHIPCHVENEGECQACDEWGWPGSAHRLWPDVWPESACYKYLPKSEKPPFAYKVAGTRKLLPVGSVTLEQRKSDGAWLWVIEFLSTDLTPATPEPAKTPESSGARKAKKSS